MPGTTLEYWEDNLTGDVMRTARAYWKENPPVHFLVAAIAVRVGAMEAPEEKGTPEQLVALLGLGDIRLPT